MNVEISYQQLQGENQKLQKEIHLLNEQLDWLKRQIFGKRSEKVVQEGDSTQLYIEGLEPLPPSKKEEREVVAAHERRKPRRNGQDAIDLPDDIPVKSTFLDISEEEKICQETGTPLVQIGVEVSRKIAHKPGSFYVKETIRPKYAAPKNEEAGINIAELPESLLPKCRADESLLAEIATKKFADHLPLYRIEEILKREGIKISRKLLSQWLIRSGKALKPLYDEMLKQILNSKNIYIDETPVKLQSKGKCKQGYMWVVVGGHEADPPYRVYQFKESRSHSHVQDILGDYRGGLHSDKYGAYQKLAEAKIITWHPCMSHVRRKFFEAEAGDPEFRKWVLMKIRHLFMLERVGWARSSKERLIIRKTKSAKIIVFRSLKSRADAM